MRGIADVVLVEVPPVGDLSEPQVCGRNCVWCGNVLPIGRSVDLGEREEQGRRWFPRGCARCTVFAVHGQLVRHTQMCEQCVAEGVQCPASAELRRALRQGRSQ